MGYPIAISDDARYGLSRREERGGPQLNDHQPDTARGAATIAGFNDVKPVRGLLGKSYNDLWSVSSS